MMKKFYLFAAITILFTQYTLAEPNDTAIATPAQASPIDAINVPDTDDTSTSPITDLDPMTENESLIINADFKAVPKTDHDEDATYHYTIDVTYPQIAGKTLSPAAQAFNQTMMNMINEQIDQFKNNVKLDAVHMNTLPEEIRKNTFKIDYDIDVIKPDNQTSIISVRLSIEGMQAGRPHPFHAHRVLNFDLTHGKVLALNDLFKKNAKYLATIAQYSSHKLNETLQDKWLIAEGTKPDPNNYKNWNLEADSLLITFDEYQVAPYVNGPQEVEIPLSELTPLFTTDAPVLAEYKNVAPNNTSTTKALAKKKDSKKIADANQSKKVPLSKTIG